MKRLLVPIVLVFVLAALLLKSRRAPTPLVASPSLPAPRAADAERIVPGRPAESALADVRRVVAEAPGSRARELLAQLDREREGYDEVARAYDDLHRRYQADFLRHAPETTVRAEAAELDGLLAQLWDATSRVNRASADLSDLLVAEAIAASDPAVGGR